MILCWCITLLTVHKKPELLWICVVESLFPKGIQVFALPDSTFLCWISSIFQISFFLHEWYLGPYSVCVAGGNDCWEKEYPWRWSFLTIPFLKKVTNACAIRNKWVQWEWQLHFICCFNPIQSRWWERVIPDLPVFALHSTYWGQWSKTAVCQIQHCDDGPAHQLSTAFPIRGVFEWHHHCTLPQSCLKLVCYHGIKIT